MPRFDLFTFERTYLLKKGPIFVGSCAIRYKLVQKLFVEINFIGKSEHSLCWVHLCSTSVVLLLPVYNKMNAKHFVVEFQKHFIGFFFFFLSWYYCFSYKTGQPRRSWLFGLASVLFTTEHSASNSNCAQIYLNEDGIQVRALYCQVDPYDTGLTRR